MNKHKILTQWKKEDSAIDSEYGVITYLKWCKEEAKRIGAGAFLKQEVHNGVKFCCVAR